MQSTLKHQQKSPIAKRSVWRVIYHLEWLVVVLMIVVVGTILLQAVSA